MIYQTDTYLSVLAQYTALTPDQADAASGQIVLALPQSAPSHYMNLATFGPDGYMYVAKGDSGAGTHGVLGQDLSTLHGKILRLDMNGGTPYDIPPDNPFVGIAGLDEIWAYGLRNPWRFSFDRLTGDLWIGDVGDATREEFSMQPAASSGGENYGWNCMEGVLCHLPADGCTCGEPSLVEPLYDYSHSVGCAMIGGYVYRGSAIPSLQGRYVFGDVCSGRVQAYEPSSGEVIDLFTVVGLLISFGEMLDGELYALSANQIVKLVFTDCNGNNTPDVQDISRGGSIDCNDNSVPDECESDCNGNGIADGCDIADGTSKDTNGNGIPDECDAASDINGDGVVSTADLLLLLGAWGPCGKRCPADLDGNGVVSTSDLLILLTNWG